MIMTLTLNTDWMIQCLNQYTAKLDSHYFPIIKLYQWTDKFTKFCYQKHQQQKCDLDLDFDIKYELWMLQGL